MFIETLRSAAYEVVSRLCRHRKMNLSSIVLERTVEDSLRHCDVGPTPTTTTTGRVVPSIGAAVHWMTKAEWITRAEPCE